MNKIIAISALALTVGVFGVANAQYQGAMPSPTTVADAKELKDDTLVVLVGQIDGNLGDEKYTFKDSTGSINVEIDDEDWNGVKVNPGDTIQIQGQVDKEFMEVEIDVDAVTLKK